MDTSTEFEKAQAIKDFEAKQQSQYHIGKVLVFIIAAANIVGATISACFSLSVILIIQILLSIALFYGSSWVRYFFAIGAALSIFLLFYHFPNTFDFRQVFAIIYSAYYLISSIVLFASKSVRVFLYRQKHGV